MFVLPAWPDTLHPTEQSDSAQRCSARFPTCLFFEQERRAGDSVCARADRAVYHNVPRGLHATCTTPYTGPTPAELMADDKLAVHDGHTILRVSRLLTIHRPNVSETESGQGLRVSPTRRRMLTLIPLVRSELSYLNAALFDRCRSC